ncbi:MAG: hypothetical protein IJS66_02225, partial [Bacteroidales bacterium]|nr:hypothetical protein [Bacteroidales bacterium]
MSTHVSKSLLACLCAAAALVSCSKEQVTEEPVSGVKLVPMTFQADLSQLSKAYLDSSDQLCWAEGDELLIWDGTQSCVFTLEAGYAGSTSGKFTGYVTEGAQEFSAIYPATDASGNEWTWNASVSAFNWGVPALQTPGAQSSDRFALIATASAHRGGQLLFTNAPALLRFTVAAGVSEVIFHSRSKELLAAGSTSVTVSIPDAEGGTYEAAINPGTY